MKIRNAKPHPNGVAGDVYYDVPGSLGYIYIIYGGFEEFNILLHTPTTDWPAPSVRRGATTPSQSSPCRVQHTSHDVENVRERMDCRRERETSDSPSIPWPHQSPPLRWHALRPPFPLTGHLHHHPITTKFVRIIYLLHTKESCAFAMKSDRVGSRGRGADVICIIYYIIYFMPLRTYNMRACILK